MEAEPRLDQRRYLAAKSDVDLRVLCEAIRERHGLPPFWYDCEVEGADSWVYAYTQGASLGFNVTRISEFVTPSAWTWMLGSPRPGQLPDHPFLGLDANQSRADRRDRSGVGGVVGWSGCPVLKKRWRGTMTREEFFARPNYWYYSERPIPDDWIAAAWEELPEFRDNVTCEFVREARKNGDLYLVQSALKNLASILPLSRMVEVYERVRAGSPHRESEFRPAFARVFGERMAFFPAPLPPQPFDERTSSEDTPDSGPDDDAIPY